MNLNEARKFAGLPTLNEDKGGEYADIIQKLTDAGAFQRGGIEWVDQDEDDEDVTGPDGKSGWFNSSNFSHAVRDNDPTAVRDVVKFMWLIERFVEGHAEHSDYRDLAKMVPFAKIIQQ